MPIPFFYLLFFFLVFISILIQKLHPKFSNKFLCDSDLFCSITLYRELFIVFLSLVYLRITIICIYALCSNLSVKNMFTLPKFITFLFASIYQMKLIFKSFDCAILHLNNLQFLQFECKPFSIGSEMKKSVKNVVLSQF